MRDRRYVISDNISSLTPRERPISIEVVAVHVDIIADLKSIERKASRWFVSIGEIII